MFAASVGEARCSESEFVINIILHGDVPRGAFGQLYAVNSCALHQVSLLVAIEIASAPIAWQRPPEGISYVLGIFS